MTRRTTFYRRRSKRRFSFLKALVLLTMIIGAIVWLDQRNPTVFSDGFYVLDGDSLSQKDEKLRLVGIDAPELSQMCQKNGSSWPCGRQSRTALRKLIKGADVTCSSTGLDKYDRWLVTCMAGETNINEAMVLAGWAVDYGGYASAENTARSKKRGIWAGTFEAPQEWRRAQRGSAAGTVDAPTADWLARGRALVRRLKKEWIGS